MRLDVRHNFGDIAKRLDRIADELREKVIPQTLNALAQNAERDMAREISREFNITRAQVSEGLRIDRATAKAGKRFLTATLYAPSRKRGRGLNLIRFVEKKVTFAEARRRAKAGTLPMLRVAIKRGNTKVLQRAFIANNGRTVFERTGKARLPIKALTTIDIPQMFMTRRIHQRVVARIQSTAASVLREKLELAKLKMR